MAGDNQNRRDSILQPPDISGQQQQAAFRCRLHVCLQHERRPALPLPAGEGDKLRLGRGAVGGGVPATPQDGGSSSRGRRRRRPEQDVL
jgi:hypothetical protein